MPRLVTSAAKVHILVLGHSSFACLCAMLHSCDDVLSLSIQDEKALCTR